MKPGTARSTYAFAVLAVVSVLVLLSVSPGVLLDQLTISNIDSEFDEVAENGSRVHTTVFVANSNALWLPSMDLQYSVALNDIHVLSGSKTGVRISSGRNTVETVATFDNTQIPEWWVSHVNNDEQTTMTTDATVVYGPFEKELWSDQQVIETDILGAFESNGSSTVRIDQHNVLVIGNQTAEWGVADAETTPIRLETRLENVHNRPIKLDGTYYEIRMNGVVVGSGETDAGLELGPGNSTTFEMTVVIETAAMREWWVSHLRNGESTTLEIAVFSVVEDDDGDRQRLPIALYEKQATLETDLLESGETSITPRTAERAPVFEQPTIKGTQSEWGAVRRNETEIETAVKVCNPNNRTFTDLLTLSVHQRTTVAGITVAEGSQDVDALPVDEGTINVSMTKQHEVVPAWWAAHLQNGERSGVRTELTGVADVTVTTLPVAIPDRESVVRTDLLSQLNSDAERAIRSDVTNQRVATVHSTSARWVDPTPEAVAISVTVDIENENRFSSITISDVDYVVDINDVRLADGRTPEEYTIGPGERRTIEFTITLNNSRMAAWWPTHVENDEVSIIDPDVWVTVETVGRSERKQLDFLSEEIRVETDMLSGK